MADEVGGTHDYAIPFETVGVLLKKYRDRDPDKTALVDLDQDKSITFGQLHSEANRIARCLADMGTGKGDRIAVKGKPARNPSTATPRILALAGRWT